MNNNFRRHRTSLAIMLALVTSTGLQVAHAGAGWGDSFMTSTTNPAGFTPMKVPTYYANSPSGLLDEVNVTGTYVDCFITAPPATGAFDTSAASSFVITPPVAGVPLTGSTCDSGGFVDANGVSKGLRKFVDTLPGLNAANNLGNSIPVAVADKTTYLGSDYYEIAVVEYMQRMHSDLPQRGTRLRGYVQISANGTVPLYYLNADGTQGGQIMLPNGKPAMAMAKPSYLGPVINSTSGTPTRLKFYNLLPASTAGNLHVPVDETITGAGTGPDGSKYQQNRVEIHLHGGDNPWISDGTPHQWILPAADEIALKAAHPDMARGVSAKNVPDMPDPGPGAVTYYFPNGESSRLMFYHDHAIGLTRLNVYSGVAAGYLLNDKAGVGEHYPELENLLPADSIPLVIQDKTFVPKNIAMQDAKWDTKMGQEGDLWYPHVYETNQDPNSYDGTNPVGRWDWGNWFWPVFPSTYDLPTGQITGMNMTTGLSEVSTTPEAFMDTAMVNGTAYPTLNVEPKAYRFRVLNASNDRFINLGLYLAADKQTTDAINPRNSANTVLCDGIDARPATPAIPATATTPLVPAVPAVVPTQADCTEVKMVNFDTSYMPPSAAHTADGTVGFPTTGGVTDTGWGAQVGGLFPQGAPDPATAGPHIVQIGNEGGLIANPLDIPSTPLNYEYNKRSVTVLNVLERGLYLGNAERADVLVDFSKYAGKTLILYNDAPAPVPASDPRIDYYTGSGDQTGQGGSANVKPGYGPNTRTIMQIVVAPTLSGTGKTVDLAALQIALPKAYATTQAKPIVPEPEYNAAFANDAGYSLPGVAPIAKYNARIYTGTVYLKAFQGVKFNTPEAITYSPAPTCSTAATCATALKLLQAQPNGGLVTTAAGGAVNAYVQSKAIQELFDPTYGRMNATLGVEIPFTSALTQTTIPLGYVDPTTETVADGETQFWKITHNGVDTHPVHFHLVNVQVINRIGWDGTIKTPYGDEIGWKETVKMNPLEDIVVAVRAKKPTLQGVAADANGTPIASNAFGLPTSSRLMDPSQAIGSAFGFTQVDPTTGNPAVKTNQMANFGWEYVWHCHILGHEENDFMRPLVFNANELTPDAPTLPAINGNVLTWTDNAKTEYAYRVESAPLTNGVVGAYTDLSKAVLPALQKTGEAPLANAHSFTDTTVLIPNTDYRYRITAIGAAGNSASVTVDLATAPSAPVLTPSAITQTGLTLTWVQASTNVTGFQVWQVGNPAPIATLANTVKTYPVTGLTAGTAYQFYVVALNNALATPSNTVSVTTVAAQIVAAPTNVSIQRTTATAAILSWIDASDNEKSFQVQSSTNGGTTWTNLGAVMNRTAAQALSVGTAVNANAIAVTATTNALYRVNVTSIANATASSASVALNNTVAPSAPTGLSATKVSSPTVATVTLTWNDTSNNNATFALQRSTNGGTTWTTISTTLGANVVTTKHTIANTPGIITNLYRVLAANSVGSSAWSNTFTIITP
ncbi:MAG: fibronectin type III domain-containing protein [Methylococcales bacterium]|nr:fibronectin type III domain-containing protein [Methylococcales bacterium]